MSFNIGEIAIKDPVFLAPMSGISDLPFRKIVKKFGAGLVFSEMIASRSMLNEKTGSIRASTDYTEESPIAVQLAGCEPDIMAQAAQMNVDRGASIIDINFGCPVKKIVKKYAGSALMQDEPLALEIMKQTVKAVDVPVTVKMRLGWDQNNLNAPKLARMAQDVGIKMVTVHGRTRDQMYNGSADWQAIRAVKQAIDIPLIVNGDIKSPEQAKQAMEIAGADGVMIGRASQGKPWLLAQTIAYLNSEQMPAAPDPASLYDLIISHFQDMLDYYGAQKGVPIARKHIAWYCSGMPHANEFRNEINKERDPDTVLKMTEEYFAPFLDKKAA